MKIKGGDLKTDSIIHNITKKVFLDHQNQCFNIWCPPTGHMYYTCQMFGPGPQIVHCEDGELFDKDRHRRVLD